MADVLSSEKRIVTMTIFDFLYKTIPAYFDEKAILYHYTSVDVLKKFIEDDGDLYCTHFGVLNDSSEMMIGLSIAENYLRKRFKWSEMKCIWFRENYNLLVRSGDIVVPWVMSFSRERDSLNQWGMYTSRETGGVAVGFEMGLLWNELDRFPGCYSKEALTAKGEKGGIQDRAFELRLLPCLYAEKDAKLIEDLFQEFLLPHEAAFRKIGDATTSDEIVPKDFTEAIFSILEVSSIIKHEAFRNEREVRLVLLPMTKSLVDCELIGGKPRWKTYVCETRKEGGDGMKTTRKALRGMIKEVVVSSHGDTDMLWTAARCLLNKYEMTWCKLEKSALPYNAR